MAWTYRWICDWDDVCWSDYLQIWQDSAETSAASSPFFHSGLIRAWVESNGGYRNLDPFFLTATSSGGLKAFLPLVRTTSSWKKGGVRFVRPVGDGLFDYHDAVFSNTGRSGWPAIAEFWKELLDELHRHAGDWWDILALPRVRLAGYNSPPLWQWTETAPYLDLSTYNTFDDYFESRSGSMRLKLKKKERRLKRNGELKLEIYQGHNAQEFVKVLPRLKAEKAKRYPGAGFPEGYLEKLVRYGSRDNGPIFCSCLTLGGQAISWRLGFCHGGILYDYIAAYDSAFSRYSPGKIHFLELVRFAFKRRLHTIDLLRGEEGWKRDWIDGQRFNIFDYSAASRSPRSRLRFSAQKSLDHLRRVKRGLRHFVYNGT